MRMRSSTVPVAPMRPRSSTVVVTSFRCGTFPTTTGSSASSAAARIGSVAFLAPEMRTSPSRGTPPWICSLSMLTLCGLFGRERLDRQGMDFPPHELPKRTVDQLVARQASQLREFARDDARGKMGVVLRVHVHLRSGEACADQARDFFRVHGPDITWAARARAYNDPHGVAPGRPGRPRTASRGCAGARLRAPRARHRGTRGRGAQLATTVSVRAGPWPAAFVTRAS